MRRQDEIHLQSNQRRMLRYVIGYRWSGKDEDDEAEEGSQIKFKEHYWQYLQRTAHEIDGHLERVGIESWVRQQRRRVFRFAGRVLRANDGRWSYAVLGWDPRFDGTKVASFAVRNPGRPDKRWTDRLEKFFQRRGMSWKDAAKDEKTWSILEDEFIQMNTNE